MNESAIIDRFVTKQGIDVRVRRLVPDDVALLIDIFENMSPESRYQRFNQSVDHVPAERIWQEAVAIARTDLDKKAGVIAFADLPDEPAAPVGAARLVATAPGEAEVAISVRDDMHGQGVGTRILRKLACLAKDQGYQRLVATIRNDNPAVWRIFSRLPFEITREPDGCCSTITVELTKPNPETMAPPTPTLDY